MQWSAKNVVRSKTHRTKSEVSQRKYKLRSVKQMELCKCGEGPAICANGQGAREILRCNRNITRCCGARKMFHFSLLAPICCGRVNREPGPVQRRRVSAVIFT